MAPVTKDSGTLTANGEAPGRSGSATASPSESAAKPQPVSLEVPISVNGVRTMEGSDKREPFSETTKTVMVYGSGAVIKLSSSVAPGQLLFLTNERTKKEVVCQVVKSKNCRNVSGYVELEFTEPAVGFWGMRFPGDRISPGPQIAATPSRPAAGGGSLASTPQPAPKIATPSANVISGNSAAKTMSPAPVNAKPASPLAPANSAAPSLGASKSKAVTPAAPPKLITTTLPSDSGLVEPWLKKPTSGSKAPAAPPIAAPPKTSPAASGPPAESSISPTFDSSRSSDKAASIFAPAEAASNLANIDLSSLKPFFDVKPAASTDAGSPEPQSPAAAPPAPAASPSDSETEDLKQHTARLQEELAKMKFTEPASSAPEKPAAETETLAVVELAAPSVETNSVHENKVQILENTSPSPAAPLLADIAEPAPIEAAVEEAKAEPAPHIPALESMEQEELKVPAWLEPLTRNTSAPSSTGELIQREKPKRAAERRPKRETPAAPLALGQERVAESRVPQFGSELPFRESRSEEAGGPSKKSGKGMMFVAIAAGVALLAAAGWWYENQQASTNASASVSSPQAQAGPAAGQNLQADLPSRAANQPVSAFHEVTKSPQGAAAARDSKAALNSANDLSGSERAGRSNKTGRDSRAASGSNGLNGASMVATSDSKPSEVVPAEEKKPVLGAVHLAAPKVSQKKNAQSGVQADTGISLDSGVPEADDAGASLGVTSKQPAAPAAPIVVGGDVKQAKLISSVAPVYPALAKTQHVSGDVTVDALIDANGRVTTMKVISGPTLLHQAAMDALKQWKYQPAILDGKPVPMHLSVTLQFRLQQ